MQSYMSRGTYVAWHAQRGDRLLEGADAALMGKRVWLYNGQRGRAY